MTEANRKPGRPRKGDQIKSETLAIKTSPALKERLASEARLNHRSLTEEVETRLTESLNRSANPRTERTAMLLEEIARNIFEIEMALGEDKQPVRWHENLAAWAAVREMLYHGPVNAVATGDAFKVAQLDKLEQIAGQIREEKLQLISMLSFAGIEADLERRKYTTLGDIMRGEATAPDREALRIVARNTEGLSDQQRQTVSTAIDRLEELDRLQQENEEARADAVEFLREAIERGRATYERPRRDPALEHALSLLWQATVRGGALLTGNAPTSPLSSGPRLLPRKSGAASATASALNGLFGNASQRDDDSGSARGDAG